MEAEREERAGNLARVAEIQYGVLPELEKELAEREERTDGADGQGGGRRGRHRRGRLHVDRHSRLAAARGRGREAHPHGGAAASARDRPGRCRRSGCRRSPARPLGLAGSEPTDRLVHLPRPNGRREDRARPRARGVHVRRRARDGPPRHVRVSGAAHGVAARRRAAWVCRLRRGRAAHRGCSAPSVHRRAPRRDREGARRGLRRASAAARRRAPDRRPGPHGRLPQHRDHHDLEHSLAERAARSLSTGVPEPGGRGRRVRSAHARAARRHRRAPACAAARPASGTTHRARDHG